MSDKNKNILEPEKCFEIIKKKLCLDAMDNFYFSYEFKPLQEFSGFLGQYFNLKVTLVNGKSERVRYLNFFVKLLPSTGVQCDFVKKGACFETEHSLYTKIFPKMLTSMDKNCVPECFLGLEGYALVLEDMSSEGYRMLDKLEFLQLEHSVIIMRHLARFHARSLIFEEKNKITVLKYCHGEKISINMCDATFQSVLDYFSKNLICMVDLIRDIDKNKKEKCKIKIAKIASQHYMKTAPSMKHRNVLCHADLWTNNILFKNNRNGKVEHCCFIDFQMARYCSPAYDLLYFLYCTTSREFRKKESGNLITIYYKALAASLKEAQMDVKKIFPMDLLKKSISEIKLSCMIHAFATMSVSLLGRDASARRTKELSPISKIVMDEFKTTEQYKNRMLDNLLDLCYNLSDNLIH